MLFRSSRVTLPLVVLIALPRVFCLRSGSETHFRILSVTSPEGLCLPPSHSLTLDWGTRRYEAVSYTHLWPASTGALTSLTFTSVPIGTISPLALRVLRFLTSLGLARKGASACAVTWYGRPYRVKSLTYNAVSYTHLDVYKRQDTCFAGKLISSENRTKGTRSVANGFGEVGPLTLRHLGTAQQ